VSTRRIANWLILGVVVLAVLAAPAAGATKLDYRLKWLYNATVVGDLYAARQGYFERADLAVDVKAGGPERDAIKELELGQAAFGVASADQVIRALDKGSPVVVLAQIFQVNPLQWIYRAAAPPIKTLQDLKGRTIGITYGGNDEIIMRTLLAQAGLKEPAVTLFSVRYDYTPFYRGQVDIWPVYRNTQGVFIGSKMRAEGDPVRYFDPAAFGVNFVSNSVVTSARMLREQPETVRRFIKALLAGWEAALDPANQAKALAILAEVDPDTARDLQAQQLAITRRLVKPRPDLPIGAIDRAGWQQTAAIMLRENQIRQTVDVARALHPEFAF
jgi:NitT/TauT family transport system substrate-binding protein